MYATMWSVAGIRESGHIVAACGLASLLQIAGNVDAGIEGSKKLPCAFLFVLCACEGVVRLSYRI